MRVPRAVAIVPVAAIAIAAFVFPQNKPNLHPPTSSRASRRSRAKMRLFPAPGTSSPLATRERWILEVSEYGGDPGHLVGEWVDSGEPPLLWSPSARYYYFVNTQQLAVTVPLVSIPRLPAWYGRPLLPSGRR